jgi:hypothetical protein
METTVAYFKLLSQHFPGGEEDCFIVESGDRNPWFTLFI